ncbi:MAG: hypothetical protein K4571_12795 [Deltaproteobacteria bacterium]
MKGPWIAAVLVILLASAVCAEEDFLTVSGKLNLRAVVPLDINSEMEYPSFLGRVKVDTKPAAWRFHTCLEGGWDGSVSRPVQDHTLLKMWDRVYQSNTPFLELKEFYGSYSNNFLEIRAGIQRFSWGRLDEYPVNDLLNPWDYSQFLRKPLEDRKIGVPSLSARLTEEKWNLEAVWVPVLVPYRLPRLTERWSGFSEITAMAKDYQAEIITRDPELPSRTLESGSAGIRIQRTGTVDWGITLFHGYDPRPVFKATELLIAPVSGKIVVDPGAVPDFHKMSSFGADAAIVLGDWSLRAEAAYAVGRYFNTTVELWGYPTIPAFGTYILNPNEHKSDTLEYGIGADYRVFEDCVLTMQAQQTLILDRPDTLYNQKLETIVWSNLKNGFLNQKVETNLSIAYNPEHGAAMAKANAWYALSDAWKVGVTAVTFRGPSQSLFGRYSKNDQVELDLVFSW